MEMWGLTWEMGVLGGHVNGVVEDSSLACPLEH